MTYATILTSVGPDPSDAPHLQAAIMLAGHFKARLLGACAEFCVPSSMDGAFGPMDMTGALAVAERSVIDANLKAAEAKFRAAVTGLETPAKWRSSIEFPLNALARLSALADLVVVGDKQPDKGDILCSAPVGDLVMRTGRPVLYVPAAGMARAPKTVVVAWKNTREARRAVTDALPFLELAQTVVVYSVLEQGDEAQTSADMTDVLAYLEARGISATGATMPRSASAGEDLLVAAAKTSADLLVSGAYGRTRLEEWMFGGVTKTLIGRSAIPVLLSH